MYIGALETISNRETWTDSVTVTDDNDAAISIAAATAIVIAVSDPQCRDVLLIGTLTDGHVTRPNGGADGVFSWKFTDTETRKLSPKTYKVGITITIGDVSQLAIADLPVLHGAVP